jgi:hypothetical protein
MLKIWVTLDENANPSEKKDLRRPPDLDEAIRRHIRCVWQNPPEVAFATATKSRELPPPGRSVG